MLPPNELKNKTFTRVVRGYNPDEVNEHIAFVIEKYTELYRENDRLERKLKTVTAQYEALRRDEEGIRNALINAQRAGTSIVSEANERAEVIMRAAKTNCDKVLDDFRAEVRAEREKLAQLRSAVDRFKEDLFRSYQQHIDFISEIHSAPQETIAALPEEQLVRRAIDATKESIAVMTAGEEKTSAVSHVVVADEAEYPDDLDTPTENAEPIPADNAPYLEEIFSRTEEKDQTAASLMPDAQNRTPHAVLSLEDTMSEPEKDHGAAEEISLPPIAQISKKDIFAPDPLEETLMQVRGKPEDPDGIRATVRSLNSQIRSAGNGKTTAVPAENAAGPASDDADYLEFIRNMSGSVSVEQPIRGKNDRHAKKKKEDDFDSFLNDLEQKN